MASIKKTEEIKVDNENYFSLNIVTKSGDKTESQVIFRGGPFGSILEYSVDTTRIVHLLKFNVVSLYQIGWYKKFVEIICITSDGFFALVYLRKHRIYVYKHDVATTCSTHRCGPSDLQVELDPMKRDPRYEVIPTSHTLVYSKLKMCDKIIHGSVEFTCSYESYDCEFVCLCDRWEDKNTYDFDQDVREVLKSARATFKKEKIFM